MKPEIKAMLPEFPEPCDSSDAFGFTVYKAIEIHGWLDKLTEGAAIKYGSELGHVITTDSDNGDTHRYLVIPLGEIKKQTPLEIAVEALQNFMNGNYTTYAGYDIAREALAKIEAAK